MSTQASPAWQDGFRATSPVPTSRATDPQPPRNWVTFDGADVDDLGLRLCLVVWERLKGLGHRS